jgi:hypothetical protein
MPGQASTAGREPDVTRPNPTGPATVYPSAIDPSAIEIEVAVAHTCVVSHPADQGTDAGAGHDRDPRR